MSQVQIKQDSEDSTYTVVVRARNGRELARAGSWKTKRGASNFMERLQEAKLEVNVDRVSGQNFKCTVRDAKRNRKLTEFGTYADRRDAFRGAKAFKSAVHAA